MAVEFKSKVEMDHFLEQVQDRDRVFSLNACCPMPESLRICSPNDLELTYTICKAYRSASEMPHAVVVWLEAFGEEMLEILRRAKNKANQLPMRNSHTAEDGKEIGSKEWILQGNVATSREEFLILGGIALENLIRYGSTDWYRWANQNWGCKWDTCNAKVERTSDVTAEIVFNTPWSTPLQGIIAVSEKFPNAVIDVRYADEDLGYNCGWYTLESGECVENSAFPLGGDDAFDYSCEIWNYDPAEMREEMR